MKAKELAEILLRYPDYNVQVIGVDNRRSARILAVPHSNDKELKLDIVPLGIEK